MNKLFDSYSKYEDDLIRKFNEHSFYNKFPKFTKKQFTEYLLQLGYMSFEFVKFVERAKFALQGGESKEAVREILRDEIPASGPTHQDNRIHDLRKVGLSFDQILNTPATSQTKKLIVEYYRLIEYPQADYDLKILIILRVIGEVLVGETYRHVVEGLVKHFKMNPKDSLFYTFHWKHDQKGGTGDEGGKGHTEYYDRVLQKLITSEAKLKIAKQIALRAFEVRLASKIRRMFQNFGMSSDDEARATALVGELGNNVFDHNDGQWPTEVRGAIILAQSNPTKRQIEVVVADPGIGFAGSLKAVNPAIKSDVEAIQLGLSGVTGRVGESRGNGLRVIQNWTINKFDGIVKIHSGSGLVVVDKNGQTSKSVFPVIGTLASFVVKYT